MSAKIGGAPSSSIVPAANGGGQKKRFNCSWPGCKKSFGRSEHLHRHALNHKEGNCTCTRCNTHFRRRDLLDRHMQRHKEKDDEAGGPGLGVLATRKKLWKDASGTIVNGRRPHRTQATSRLKLKTNIRGVEQGQQKERSAPPSPPNSVPSSSSGQTGNGTGLAEMNSATWPTIEMELPSQSFANVGGADLDFLSNSSWGDQPLQAFMGASSELPFDDIFKPDTAMSFNAPFTTTGYYDWLFENEANQIVEYNSLLQNHQTLLSPLSPMANSSAAYNFNNQFLNTFSAGLDSGLQATSNPSETQLRNIRSNIDCSFTSPSTVSNSGLSEVGIESPPTMPGSSYLSNSSYKSITQPSQISTPPAQRVTSLSSCPLPDSFARKSANRLPVITNEARQGLMQIIKQSCPTKKDGSPLINSDPLLSISSLQHYSDLFFTRFNSSYPLIHQPTFQPSRIESFLLMAIVLLGATYSDTEAHAMAVCIHDVMRPLIHGSSSFSTRPSLWMLQTILLVECFGKSRAGQKQHDMSHLYHGLLINLIRRSDCQTAYVLPFDETTNNLEEYWHMAIEAEQKRRLAMLCFMWDTQHAVLFSQSLCMNASELKLTLPWDPAVWEASTANEWISLTRTSLSPPQYLSILKMYTNPSGSSPPQNLNALSRALVLHGLMSISWDLNRRDQTSLNIALTASSLPWQLRMSACYDRWRLDFDSYTSSVLSSLSFSPAHHAQFQRFAIANLAVYHTAHLILDVDIIDLQIYAGATHIIGRPVTDFDRQRSKNNLGDWIRKDEGRSAGRAVWHAARLFRDGIRKLENWNVDEMFHYPWCLYLSTLMCWLLHKKALETQGGSSDDALFKNGPAIRLGNDIDDEDGDWDSKVEMNALVSALTCLDPGKESFVRDIWIVVGKHKTTGLIKCLIKQLRTIRWAVVREGVIVLKRLVEKA